MPFHIEIQKRFFNQKPEVVLFWKNHYSIDSNVKHIDQIYLSGLYWEKKNKVKLQNSSSLSPK